MTMKAVTINKLSEYEGKAVELRGWVYNIRSIGKIWFIIFRDGTGLLQGVVVKGTTVDFTITVCSLSLCLNALPMDDVADFI